MRGSRGFTLIEILIALSIFAILATITSTALYNAFTTRTYVTAQADQLNSLQLAISLIQQDSLQIVERGVRGNDMHPFSAFIGKEQYVEFTRDGLINPNSHEKRSSLKRVAFVCEGKQLVRRTWASLDMVNRDKYRDKVLLSNISDCHFNFLSNNLQTLNEWREYALDQNQTREPYPKAIQLNLKLTNWGEMNMLFILPGAVYVPR